MMHRVRAGVSRWLATGYDWVSLPARALPAALATGLLALSQLSAHAQLSINESFTGTTTSAFTLGGNAALTGTNTTPGYLRLTAANTNQAGYAILNGSFASAKGFSISFEFFSYGGTSVAPADGISVFLVDANGTDPKASPSQFSIGAYGGSLGYAQKTAASGATTTDINGVAKGYLGIGLDEYGNYATSSEGRNGGYPTTDGTPNTTTLVPQSVTLRGPGTGISGYPYLTSSGTLPFNLSVGTARAQATDADYRKAYIYVVPVNGNYQVTVRIQHGTTITTTTDSYVVSTPPTNLRIGFAGSTGSYVNVHEIRNLSILDNPYAQDDNAITKYGTPINLTVLSNDRGLGATLAPGTVDLDPSTAGIQTTYAVAGGSFSVNSQGVVTFTPAAGFAGSVSIPYVVSDILGQVSNPAIITVGVTGADVATGISGPASVSPGGQITYVVSTLNNGSEVATNVTPTLLLPAGLSIPTSASYTYNTATGLVTFNPVTLGSGRATSNTISFNAPSSGSLAATASYAYPAGAAVPDAVSSNNSASLTTTISGAANVATSCSVPGKDGPATLTSTSTANTYYPGLSVTTTDDNSTIAVGAASGSATAVAAGDLVLVMQMQGAPMITDATSAAYGTVSGSTAGQYEYALVASVSGSPVASITLASPLTNTYLTDASQSQNFQVVRVPQYSALTVNGVATGLAWNSVSKVGGVLALDVAGTTTFSGTTPGLSMTARGFTGGGGVNYTGPAPTGTNATYYATLASGAHGSKGEGIAGTPKNFFNGSSVQATGAGYATGDNNRGAPATGGGGAQDFAPATNAGNSGGGGGSNLAAGGGGGYGNGSNSSGNRALGGYAVAGSATRLLLGGGGGAGSSRSATAQNSSGGVGGGIIILRTGKVAGTATLQANGGTTTTGGSTQGGGGGGAGGTILVLATPTPSTDASGLASLTATATGGAGSSVNNGLLNTGALTASYGPGGGGSGGAVYANGALSAAATVTGGAAGSTSNGTLGRYAFGATAGTAGTASTSTAAGSTNTIGGASSCLPMLSVALSTTTPTVRRTNGTPNPATFVAVISNVGGQAQSTSTTLAMDPLFTYDNTFTPVVTLTTADGNVSTVPVGSYSVTGTSSPMFSGPSIPSGATLRLTYRATIAASAVTGTAYQASGTVAFADPTRTATATTITPGGTFTGGGTVPGANYAAASSTLEDVTIVAPLPVELVRFEAQAVRQAALLTWTTATEHDNDHFTMERSLTGGTFTAVGTVRGQGTRLQPTNYTFTDDEAGHLGAGLVYYRLRQVDVDGAATYSPVRTVRFAAPAQGALSLYPNPNFGLITLDLSSLPAGSYAVQVFDLAGRLLRTEAARAQVLSLNLTDMPPGAYLVLVQGENFRQSLPLLRN